MSDRLEPGDQAPDFTLPDDTGASVALGDFRGRKVIVYFYPAAMTPDAAANYRVIEISGLPIRRIGPPQLADELSGASWIVDALLGTGATGEPRPPYDAIIDALNAAGVPILAVDVPSGLDCDTGRAARHTIRAAHTCTFVAHKPGFLVPGAEQYTGEIHVLDIGAPRRLVAETLAKG